MFIHSPNNTMDEQKALKENRLKEKVVSEQTNVRNFLPPPNPILNKQVQSINEKVSFRLESAKEMFTELQIRPPRTKKQRKQSLQPEESTKKQAFVAKTMYKMTLTNGYQPSSMVFLKFDNKNLNKRGRVQYFSSLFLTHDSKGTVKFPQYKGMVADDDLIFSANYQSSNLMAVFKVQPNTYDLILQNDVNTKGFTQWFNFKVQNKKHNFVAKFNIVNLYKTKSLYNSGMKPIVRSQLSEKSCKKSWRRKGFNIYYDKNELHYEDDQTKFYKTLTFQYDFTVPNDTVQFGHGIPYDLGDLKKLLQSIKTNPKVTLFTIGSTLLGKSIPLIKISTPEANNPSKKALVMLSRQHPGETPGSFIGQQMIHQILKNSNEADFLLWRFDIYVFPMVNIDGVTLGNYRGNFAGFDLNRCWLKPDPLKQPEVNVIKNYIKKIAKKQQIQLILDLHGHSRKMGSFFYGNDFGQNFMMFPFIASKMNRSILFQHSKFTHETETDAKFSTARVVLGNMIKDVGYVYTYQVSFFGYFKENTTTPFSFTEDHYKELGRSLVNAMYRTFLEIQKEEKTLKQSIYIKSIKGYLSEVVQKDKKGYDSQSGSDSEAEVEMTKEIIQIQQFLESAENQQGKMHFFKENESNQKTDLKTATNSQANKGLKQFGVGIPVERYNQQIKKKIEELLEKNMQNDLKNVLLQKMPHLMQTQIKRHIQSQKMKAEDNSYSSSVQIAKDQSKYQQEGSYLSQKQMPLTYIQYLKLKKQKKVYEESLKIYGATFQLQNKPKALSANDEQLYSNTKQEPNLKKKPFKGKRIQFTSKEKDNTVKSFNTVQLLEHLSVNRQERQLLMNERTHLQKRRKNPGYYMLKQNESSSAFVGSKSIDLDIVAQSVLKVNREMLKNKMSKESKLPQIISSQQKIGSRLKLPLI